MSIVNPQYPTQVWDGTSAQRSAAAGGRSIDRGPDPKDWDQVEAEMISVQTDLIAAPWNALTLQNSWTNKGGVYGAPAYKKVGNRVTLRGAILPGTLTDGTILTTLPAGARPTNTQTARVASCAGDTDVAAAKVSIDSSGNVKIYGAATIVSVDLAGVSFHTDQ